MLSPAPSHYRGFSHSYWENCWRRHDQGGENDIPDLLNFSTGYYGLSLNVANLQKCAYGMLNDNLSYTQVIKREHRNRLDELETMNLTIEVQIDDKLYRAITARPVKASAPHLCHGRLWEAGRYFLHTNKLLCSIMYLKK